MENLKLLKINKDDENFHLMLLKYYYNFIKFYKQEENLITDVLHFDFGEETYSIVYELLQNKAYQESLVLKEKYGEDDAPDVYQI